MQRIKQNGKGQIYDCIVGVSGGLDSSYVVYLGAQYGLKMLCVHIDDGLDTEIAVQNVNALCKSANAELVSIRPNMEQYRDITRSFFLAGVPNLAMAQDNIIFKALQDIAKQYKLKYSLSGRNFSMESILQRGDRPINACDKKHVLGIQKRFGRIKPTGIRFMSLIERYVGTRYFQRVKTICPLNYIDYRMDTALADLHEFCGYSYCGGKHYESVLTRFLQCYYLPAYFDFDKRKSHFSSLIVTNQMTREEALLRLAAPAYTSDAMREADFHIIAAFIDMTDDEFSGILEQPKHRHTDYQVSVLNSVAPIARKLRKLLG